MKVLLLCSFFIIFVACVAEQKNLQSKQDSITTQKNPFISTKELENKEKEEESQTQKEFKKQLKEKVSEYKKKCDKKDGVYCLKLASAYEILNEKSDIEIKEIHKKAFEYNTNDCENGDMNACVGLGSAFESGEVVKKDLQKAKELYKKSCDNKLALGCLNLGLLLSDCTACNEDSKSKKEALPFFIKACEYGNNNACAIINKNIK
ncbi:hypothetical protein DCO58_02965 [Helicobacter saguini]|uniref:Beta-lactamase n=1 Tax=Helicobacter saguini TaxID=1548018 RepID=A0A347W2G4_9HELI|nr:tetratricopeptide repeat protein [Helicobacter saguini]MWV62663.1 hypothetical protein [Helicobacter saguini]MWV66665.1 hypothetical protein [Helicobacter saguini]MWV69015.1 hypothetical protein [Helicobacter saguini]MWV71431.1 hypothetical protein [Helicobacter saguini]TLD94081.1 sel1 repeat family protein [Helicobacter saguini]